MKPLTFIQVITFVLLVFYSTTAYCLTYTVTNTNDSNAGSFRQAILNANTNPGPDIIEFNIPGAGPHTISFINPVPVIPSDVTIDGSTQPGYVANTAVFPDPMNGTMQITIDLSGTTAKFFLINNKNNIVIRGVNIIGNNLSGAALSFTNINNLKVFGCYFGVLADGITQQPGGATAFIRAGGTSSNITIGSTNPQDRNILAAPGTTNTGNDYSILLQGIVNNATIQGNYINVGKDGTTTYTAEVGFGMASVTSCSNIMIGGPTIPEGNLISGCLIGVIFSNVSPVDPVIFQNNRVGTDYTGTVALPNTNSALRSSTASMLHYFDNLVSGNTSAGIAMTRTTNSLLLRNIVGLDITGTLPLPNTLTGITLGTSSSFNQIGDGTFANRNIIASNPTHEILLSASACNYNTIDYNYVGLDITGTQIIPSGGDGIQILQAVGTTIRNNVIAGHMGDGIHATQTSSDSLLIEFNKIGVLADGITPAGNGEHGVYLNCVGLTKQVSDNIIANNGKDGIFINDGNSFFLRNQIYNNGELGIDINFNGVDPNDPNDSDSGVNELLNYPEVTRFSVGSTGASVDFNLDVPTGHYRVEVFGVPAGSGDPSTHGEGNVFIGFANIFHPGGGTQAFSQAMAGNSMVSGGDSVSLTATLCQDASCTSYFYTSEYSKLIDVCQELNLTNQIKRINSPTPSPVATSVISSPTADCRIELTFDFEGCDSDPVSPNATVNVELVAAANGANYTMGQVIASGTYNYGAVMQGNLMNDNNWNGTITSDKPGGHFTGAIQDGSTVLFNRTRWREYGGLAWDIPLTFRYQLADPACCESVWGETTFNVFYASSVDNRGGDVSNGTIVNGYWQGPGYPIPAGGTWAVGSPIRIDSAFLFEAVCPPGNNATFISETGTYFISEVKIDGTWINMTTPIPVIDTGGGVGYSAGEIYTALSNSPELVSLVGGVLCTRGMSPLPGMTQCIHFQANWSIWTTYGTKFQGFRLAEANGVVRAEWEMNDTNGDFGG